MIDCVVHRPVFSIDSSLRSRLLVRAGEETRASLEETPAQMPMINLFFSEEYSEKLPIGQSR
jgi:hypothetical protein